VPAPPDDQTEHLRALIAAQGPIPVSRFMAEALYHPARGYYMRAEPFGGGGDFVTAPEISQMFGEIIGLWCVDTWQRLGKPDPVHLIELGPGRGTLMADMLRATRKLAPFRPVLVEVSPRLRDVQREALAEHRPLWVERFEDAPAGNFILVANELFDALPVRQFVRLKDGWHERMVGLDPGGGLAFVAAPDRVPIELHGAEGEIAERYAAGEALAETVAARVAGSRSAALIVDYGRTGALGASLQAVRAHRRVDPLAAPGTADLTAHVDFTALARAAHAGGALPHGPVGQGEFLLRLGIAQRAIALERRGAKDVAAALERLTAPEQMGALFKVLAVTPPGVTDLAGFANDSGR
jgi:NADH dehydrogenase [ubiquinone] 1 alpha subcomplex assembly factor 7